MSAEVNKAVVRRFYEEVFNQKNLDALDELCTADCIDHNPMPEQGPGLEGVKHVFKLFCTAFSDLQIQVEDMIAEGDKVVASMTGRGTHTGDLMGIAPTGKEITITGIDIFRITNGKVVERWGNSDDLGMMQQLGVIPPQ